MNLSVHQTETNSISNLPMQVTPEVIQRLHEAMAASGIKKAQIAEAVGRGPSWVTNLLKGDLQTLRPEYRLAIEELLGIDFDDSEETERQRTFSPLAHRVADLMEKSPQAAAIGSMLLNIFNQADVIPATAGMPALTRLETKTLGRDLLHLSDGGNATFDEMGKGACAIMQSMLERIKVTVPMPTSAKSLQTWLEHRGAVSAGLPTPRLIKRFWQMDSRYPADHFVARVFGPAMEPEIPDGADIILRPAIVEFHNEGDHQLGNIFLIETPAGMKMLARLQSKTHKFEPPYFDRDTGQFVDEAEASYLAAVHADHPQPSDVRWPKDTEVEASEFLGLFVGLA